MPARARPGPAREAGSWRAAWARGLTTAATLWIAAPTLLATETVYSPLPGTRKERVVWTPPTEVTGSFDLALKLAPGIGLETMVGPHFRLEEYREAIAAARASGREGHVKVIFDHRGF